MNDERMQSLLEEEFRAMNTTPEDVERSTREVLQRKAHVRQRSRWLPFPVFYRRTQTPTATNTADYQPTSIPATNGHSPTVTRRTQSMFSPVKAITAGALVFALGGVLLIAQPFDQQGGSVPGAATDTEAAAPVEFTAKWAFGNEVRTEITEVGDGVLMTRGGAWRPGVISSASDPRLEGTLSIAANSNQYVDPPVGVWNYAFRIENEEGAWQQMPTINVAGGEGDLNTTTGVLVGEGGYAGLIAVFDNLTENDTWTLHGYIIDDELTPPPEPYVTD